MVDPTRLLLVWHVQSYSNHTVKELLTLCAQVDNLELI